jgi:trk system potassium uptake protein TrkH
MPKSLFNIRIILRFLGHLLILEAMLMLICGGIDFLFKDHTQLVFLQAAGLTFCAGLFLALNGMHAKRDIGKHESFVIVTLVWVLFSLFGALPFYLSGHFNSFTDAFFESMSGFSTTGSSVLVDVEILSKGILFWRSLIQWLGGMGIILLSLAIMPMLKIGNYQLLTAEVPGPVYDKIHPRVTVAARRLWFLYSGLTILLVVLLRLGGMSLFDSICHSLTTMATGGFSTKNASIAHWDSAYIEGVTVLFMFLAGTSFVLLYRVFSGKFYKIKQNEEFKAYFYIVLVSGLVLSTALFFFADLSPVKALRTGFFQVVSIITTTGFTTADFSVWVPGIRFLLIVTMFFGAMSGSTSGNIKIGRIVLYTKISHNELKRDVHPNAVLPVFFNGRAMPATLIYNLFGYLFFYIMLMILSVGIFFAMGLNMEDSLGVFLTSFGNIGPGLGNHFNNFFDLPGIAKWYSGFLMLVGRLEIYTVFLLFSRTFWRN